MKSNFENVKKKVKQVVRKATMVAGIGSAVAGGVVGNPSEASGQVKDAHKTIITHDPAKSKAYEDSLKLYYKGWQEYTDVVKYWKNKIIETNKNHQKEDSNKEPPFYYKARILTSKEDMEDRIKSGYVSDPIDPRYKYNQKILPEKIIIPDGSNGIRAVSGSHYGYPIFKKPVQPVVYQPKQEVKPTQKQEKERIKIYTDKAEFEKADKMYKDSLNYYNTSEKVTKHFQDDPSYANTLNYDNKSRGSWGNLSKGIDADFVKVVSNSYDNKIKPQGFVWSNKGGVDVNISAVYKKPLVKPIYQPPQEKVSEIKPVENIKPVEKPKENIQKPFIPKDTLHRQPAPGYFGTINLVYEKPGGKILFYENRNGDKIPYGDSTKITKDFQYPDFKFK